jgi:hypothetical protein
VVPPAPIDLQLDSPPEEDWLLWQAVKIEAQAIIIKMSFILPPSMLIEFGYFCPIPVSPVTIKKRTRLIGIRMLPATDLSSPVMSAFVSCRRPTS